MMNFSMLIYKSGIVTCAIKIWDGDQPHIQLGDKQDWIELQLGTLTSRYGDTPHSSGHNGTPSETMDNTRMFERQKFGEVRTTVCNTNGCTRVQQPWGRFHQSEGLRLENIIVSRARLPVDRSKIRIPFHHEQSLILRHLCRTHCMRDASVKYQLDRSSVKCNM